MSGRFHQRVRLGGFGKREARMYYRLDFAGLDQRPDLISNSCAILALKAGDRVRRVEPVYISRFSIMASG